MYLADVFIQIYFKEEDHLLGKQGFQRVRAQKEKVLGQEVFSEELVL